MFVGAQDRQPSAPDTALHGATIATERNWRGRLELLVVQQEQVGGGDRVGSSGEPAHVRHPFFLVDDGVEDHVQVFGPRLAGAGGFINISQNAKKVVFVGTFTAGHLDVAVDAGKLRIFEDGKSRKFVEEVEHRTFSGPQAAKWRKPVLYVTERCVFRLCPEGLELIEIAPGVDLQKDILDQMEFVPVSYTHLTLPTNREV